MSKRLLFVTGTRADFGKIEPLAKASLNAGYKVDFFITGMHMMSRYGETKLEVKRFKGADFFEFVNQREGDPQDLVLAKTVLGLSDFVHEHKPDLVIIHGDRVEALAAALVCSMNYILSAHIEGGEVSGTIDESIRHCNTKLCSKHFVSSRSAKNRVLQLGEANESIYIIGSPELDVHAQATGISIETVKQYYDIPFEQYGIVVFHPVTSEQNTIGNQAKKLFSVLNDSGHCFVVIAPNNDPGSADIFHAIEQLPSHRFRVLPSMRFLYFSELMRHASIIVGNSSAGVREAPFLGVASIDIGTRQHRRANSDSISNCDALDTKGLENALTSLWGKRFQASQEFGKGDAADAFIETLESSSFWTDNMQKVFGAQQ